MAAFASPEWIELLAARAARAEADPALEITIEQRVEGDPPTAWHVAIAHGRISVSAGENPAATLRLSSDRETAVAIHAGNLSAQRAFLNGALRVGGNIGELVANRAALDAVAALLTNVT